MSNSYFQFKQFMVRQDRCAMKVSTDACILGAWTPIHNKVKRVLDIGAGTGLLSLMLAQRNHDLQTDGIELDATAGNQAKENVDASPWGSRIRMLQGDARHYSFTDTYDMVICNPPFFQSSLLGPDNERNLARHTISMSYPELTNIIKQVLKPDGYASILIPHNAYDVMESAIHQNGGIVYNRLYILPKEHAKPNRVICLCSFENKIPEQDQVLSIRKGDMTYTDEFIALLQPYYLHL